MKPGLEGFRYKVERGDIEYAQWKSLAANAKHGKRRTRADKRRAINRALKGWGQHKSDREIARHIGCSHATVGKYRDQLSGQIDQIEQREVTRNATRYKQDTSNNGGGGLIRKPTP